MAHNGAIRLEITDDLLLHAARPEFPEMYRHLVGGGIAAVMTLVIGDLVRHVDQRVEWVVAHAGLPQQERGAKGKALPVA